MTRPFRGQRCPMHPYPKPEATVRVGGRWYCDGCASGMLRFLEHVTVVTDGVRAAKQRRRAG